MIQTCRRLFAAALLLFCAGCAGFDDSREQSEFEKLRTYPNTPEGERLLPSFDSRPATDEDLPFA